MLFLLCRLFFLALFRLAGSRFLARRFFTRRIFLLVRGFFCFRGGLVRFVAVAATGFFSTVVGDVPARAFELNGRRGDYRLDLAA